MTRFGPRQVEAGGLGTVEPACRVRPGGPKDCSTEGSGTHQSSRPGKCPHAGPWAFALVSSQARLTAGRADMELARPRLGQQLDPASQPCAQPCAPCCPVLCSIPSPVPSPVLPLLSPLPALRCSVACLLSSSLEAGFPWQQGPWSQVFGPVQAGCLWRGAGPCADFQSSPRAWPHPSTSALCPSFLSGTPVLCSSGVRAIISHVCTIFQLFVASIGLDRAHFPRLDAGGLHCFNSKSWSR